jgi:quinoprotein glucose dehydrogenase
VGQTEVPGEQTSPTQPIPSRPAPYAQQGMLESDLIDYTPAIKDSALKLAKQCRMGPYFIPGSPLDGKGKGGKPTEYKCSWYAPGASGGVNIDGGAAADPVTGMLYVGGQTGMSTIAIAHDPCSALPYTSPHDSCGKPGALKPPPGYKPAADGAGRGGAFARLNVPTTNGGVSILKPKEMGGITAYDMNSGDKKWWVPNGNRWRDVTTNDPLFAGVKLPRIAALGGQPEVITTKTLVIHGTGRSGGPGGGGRAGRAGGRAGGPPATPPQLYAFDKATGKQVGAVNIPAVNTAVPMTFLHNGKQYVVFATGQGENTSLVALTLPRK